MIFQSIKRKQKAIVPNQKANLIINILLIADSKPYLASYCTVCGKIRSWNYCLEKCEGGYRELPKEEVYSKYKDLEQIAIKDLFVKYVPLKAD